ncbi:hypothetical protein EON79_04535, partial [bacterium]
MAPHETMIVAALLALSPLQEAPSAGPIISKMMAHYAGAFTAQGTIVTTQSAKNVSVVTQTGFAMSKPNRLRISQTRNGSQGGKWLVVSDGNKVSYDRPKGVFGPARFSDPTEPTLPEVYTAVLDSLGEKSIPLDILIGRSNDLQTFRGILVTPISLV